MRDDPAVGDMPPADAFSRTDPPVWEVVLWPHSSLTRRGLRWFMTLLVAGLAVPAVALAPSPILWVLLPFEALAALLVWAALAFSRRQGRVREAVRLWPDLVTVERTEPDGHIRRWAANPYWVRVGLADTRSLPSYLTLAGGGRTIELGTFLTPDERAALAGEIRRALARVARG